MFQNGVPRSFSVQSTSFYFFDKCRDDNWEPPEAIYSIGLELFWTSLYILIKMSPLFCGLFQFCCLFYLKSSELRFQRSGFFYERDKNPTVSFVAYCRRIQTILTGRPEI